MSSSSSKDPAILVLVSPHSTTTTHDNSIDKACAMLSATVGVPTYRLIYHAHVAVSPPLWRRALGRASPSPLSFPTDEAATSAIEALLGGRNNNSTAPSSHEPFTDPSHTATASAGIVQVAAEGGSGTCGDRYVHVDGAVTYQTSVAHTLAALPNVVGVLVLPQGGAQTHPHWYNRMRNTPIELLLDTMIAQGGVGVSARMGLVRRSRLPVPTLVMRQSTPPTTEHELTSTTHAPLERGGAVVWIDGQHFIGQPTAEVEACSRVLASHIRLSAPTGATLDATTQHLRDMGSSTPLLRVLVSQPTPVSTMYSTFGGMEGSGGDPPTHGDEYGGAYGDGTRRKVVELNAMSAQLLSHIIALTSKALLASHPGTTRDQSVALSAALKSVVVAVDPLAVPEGVVPGFGGRYVRDHIEATASTMPTSAVVLRAHPVGGKNRWTKAAVRDANSAITSVLSDTVPLLLI